MFKYLVIALLGLFSAQVQAAKMRSFYKATMKVTMHYTQIESGTEELFRGLPLDVRYSDDHDFCRVVVGGASFKCHSYHPDNTPEQVMITIDRGIGGQILAAALTNHKCDPKIRESFARLATYLDDTIDIEWQGKDFYQQIHDEQPESFHIWFFEMSKGEKY